MTVGGVVSAAYAPVYVRGRGGLCGEAAGARPPHDGGRAGRVMALEFTDEVDDVFTALRGAECIAAACSVSELKNHVYAGDALMLLANVLDAADARLEAEFYGAGGA